jgi:hypothetical protein
MGCFPAIFSSDEKRVVFTSSLQLLERVWRMLKPREAVLRETTGYVNEELGVLYIEPEHPEEREDQEPERLLTVEEFGNRTETEEKPFRWAFGLMGGRTFEEDAFLQHLVTQASKLDPTFTSATT